MITGLYAGILGLLYVALAMRVIRLRFRHRVSLGDGGQAELLAAIRSHGNFAEYVPLALLLMAMAELDGCSDAVIHAFGILLTAGRVLHVWGLAHKDGGGTSWQRKAGMVATFTVIILLSLMLIGRFIGLL